MIALLFPQLSWNVLRGSGHAWTYRNTKDTKHDYSTFHFGMLDPRQRYVLEHEAPQLVGNPVGFTNKGLRIEKDDEILIADVVIFCTGYRSGVDQIKTVKDGKPHELELDKKLFEHIICPDFPILSSCTNFSTTAGPMRGASVSEYLIYHLCVRRQASEEAMRVQANRLFGHFTLRQSILFADGFFQKWIRLLLDLVLRGLIPWQHLLIHFIQILLFGFTRPPTMNLLPRLPKKWRKGGGAELREELVIKDGVYGGFMAEA